MKRRIERGDFLSANASACSRPPEPIIKTFIPPRWAFRAANLGSIAPPVPSLFRRGRPPGATSALEIRGNALRLAPPLCGRLCSGGQLRGVGPRNGKIEPEPSLMKSRRLAVLLALASFSMLERAGCSRVRRSRPHFPQIDDVQAPDAERQARGLRRRRSGHRRGRLPLHGAGKRRPRGRIRPCGADLGRLARLPPIRPDQDQGKVRTGRRRVPRTPFAVLQENANRPRLRLPSATY